LIIRAGASADTLAIPAKSARPTLDNRAYVYYLEKNGLEPDF
jgi:hypothetical protein